MDDLRTIYGSSEACCFCNGRDGQALVRLNDEFAYGRSVCAYKYAAETCYCFQIMLDSAPMMCRPCCTRLEESWAFFTQIRSAQAELRRTIEENTAFEEIKTQSISSNISQTDRDSGSDDEDYDNCRQAFQPEILLEHGQASTAAEDMQFACQICRRAFAKLTNLRHHWKRDHRSKILYICNGCPETFRVSIDAMRHQENEHDDRTLPRFKGHEISQTVNGRKTRIKMCDSCGEMTSEDSQLFQHAQSKHKTRHICHVCAKEFKAAGNLRSHLQSHTDLKLACDVCGKVYKNAQILRVHKQKHADPDRLPYICPRCPDEVRFKNRQQRQRHLVEVHNEARRTFKCNLCPKEFTDTGGRSGHMRSFHLKQYNYACPECDFQAVRKDHLDRHMITHTGARDFKCEACGKTFSWKRNLMQHMKIHNNIRDYACAHCDMAFVQKISLLTHMKMHQ